MDKNTINNKGISLPSPNTTRWVKSRKKAVVDAISAGTITVEDACREYSLSEEELMSWYRMLENHGPDALKTTHLKRYRKQDLKNQSFSIKGENAPTLQ